MGAAGRVDGRRSPPAGDSPRRGLLARHGRGLDNAQGRLDLALDGRAVPRMPLPELDDIRLGALGGAAVESDRAWRRTHATTPCPPARAASPRCGGTPTATRRVLDSGPRCALLVRHDIPIRSFASAVRGEDPLHGPVHRVPNAVPLPFTVAEVGRGLAATRGRLAD